MIKLNTRVYDTRDLLFLLNLCLYFTVSHSSNDFTITINGHNTHVKNCTDSEFCCKSGQRVDRSLSCDGVKDCVDGSDESFDQCKNTSCPSYVYRCGYGACVPQTAKCDGRIDCVDKSDESPLVCAFDVPSVENVCKKNQFQCFSEQCIDMELACDGKRDCIDGSDETFIRCQSWTCDEKQSFRCDYGACINKSYLCDGIKQCADGSDESARMCKINNGTIEHPTLPLPQSNKKCNKLNPVNVDLKCYRNGSRIDCDEDLIVGTKVRPICKPFHTYKDLVPVYQEIICQEDGQWDYKLFSCIHECGRPYRNHETTLITNEPIPERPVDSPWHVAIYDKNKIMICSGTVISPYLVLTAAHCFDSQISYNNVVNVDNYEIVVSKVTKNYSIIDHKSQQAYKVKDIRLSKGYAGESNYYANDIALIISSEKIDLDVAVLPACVDWIHTRKYQPPEGTPGKLIGWEIKSQSEDLRVAFISYISRDRCSRRVPENFTPYLTNDKFCAGSEDDSYEIPRSTGSGFLIKDGSYYYIRGILSLKSSANKFVAAFTDIAPHIGWILGVRSEVELQNSKLKN